MQKTYCTTITLPALQTAAPSISIQLRKCIPMEFGNVLCSTTSLPFPVLFIEKQIISLPQLQDDFFAANFSPYMVAMSNYSCVAWFGFDGTNMKQQMVHIQLATMQLQHIVPQNMVAARTYGAYCGYHTSSGDFCLLMYGGQVTYQTRSATNEIWQYSFKSNQWVQISCTNMPLRRICPAFTYHEQRHSMFVHGGRHVQDNGDCDTHLNDLWELQLDSMVWQQHPSVHVEAAFHSMCCDDELLYIVSPRGILQYHPTKNIARNVEIQGTAILRATSAMYEPHRHRL